MNKQLCFLFLICICIFKVTANPYITKNNIYYKIANIPEVTGISQISPTKAKLEWKIQDDNLSSTYFFEIYKSIDGGSFLKTGVELSSLSRSYVFNELEVGKNYCFKIKTVSNSQTSDFSNEKCITTVNTLQAPSIDKVQALSGRKIRIDWTNPSELNSITGFALYKSTEGGNFQIIDGQIDKNTSFYIDDNALANQNYCYKLKTFESTYFSPFSLEKCGNTINNLLPPTLIEIDEVSGSGLTLKWSASATAASQFNNYLIFKSVDGLPFETSGLKIASNLTTYTFNNLLPGKKYCFKILITDNINNSILSNEICETINDNTLKPPQLKIAEQVSPNKVRIAWEASPSFINSFYSYYIYRSENDGPYTYSGNTTNQGTEFLFTDIEIGKKYCFKLKTTNFDSYSLFSNELCQTTISELKPPQATIATQINTSKTKVEWNIGEGSVENFTGYVLYRSIKGGFFSKIVTLDKGINSYVFNDIEADFNYCYKVYQTDGISLSNGSNEVCFKNINYLTAPKFSKIEGNSQLQMKLYFESDQVSSISKYYIYSNIDNKGYVGEPIIVNSDQSIYMLQNIRPNTKYCFKVKSFDGQNFSPYSNEICETISLKPDKVEINPLKQVDLNQIYLQWNYSLNGFLYNAYSIWRSVDGGDFEILKDYLSTNTTNYFDKSVVSSKNYCYKIEGKISNLNSIFSDEKCIEPKAKIETPIISEVTQNTTNSIKISLKKLPPGGFVGNIYKVYRSVEGENFKIVENFYDYRNSYVDYNVTIGKKYCYKILNVLGENQSDFSNEECFTTINNYEPPVISNISQLSAKSIKIDWEKSTTPESQFSNYLLYVSVDGAEYQRDYQSYINSKQSSYTFNQAVVGKEYCFKIKISDGNNLLSSFSNEKCFTTTNTLVAPVINKITPISSKKIKIEWLPDELNIKDATNFTIYLSSNGIDYRYANTVYPNQNYFVYEFAEVGINYCFKIKASDNINSSEFSNEKCLTAINTLVAPVINKITPISSKKIKIEWLQNEQNIIDVTNYTIYLSTNGIDYRNVGAVNPRQNYFDYYVEAGTNYCFKIKASDGINSSEFSNEKCAKTINTLLAPIVTNAEALGINKIKISWQSTTTPIEDFNYYIVNQYIDGVINTTETIYNKSLTDFTFNDIIAGKNYCFDIQLNDGYNYSIKSNQKCAKTINTLEAPILNTVTQVTPSKFTINWSYSPKLLSQEYLQLWRKDENGGYYNFTNLQYDSKSTIINYLYAGRKYCYKIRSAFGNNYSEFSNEICGTLVNDYKAGEITKITEISPSKIKLEWAPTTNIFKNIKLFFSENGNEYNAYNDYTIYVSDNQLSTTIINLKVGVKYCYKFQFFDDGNNSSPFSNEACITTKNTLEPPSLTKVTALDPNEVKLEWLESTTQKDHFSEYQIFRSTDGGTFERINYAYNSQNNIKVSGLISGKNYCFKIRTSDGNNVSKFSNELCVVTINDLEPPTLTGATQINSNSLNLTWNASPTSINNFEYYHIYRSENDGEYKLVKEYIGRDNLSTNFNDIVAGKKYCFKIFITDLNNYSKLSNEICATNVNKLKAPILEAVNSKASNTLELKWKIENNQQQYYDRVIAYQSKDKVNFTKFDYQGSYRDGSFLINGIKAGQEYCYKISLFDGYNESALSNVVCGITKNDLQPPANIKVEQNIINSINVRWDAPKNNQAIRDYNLYMKTDTGAYQLVRKVDYYDMNYQIQNLKFGIKYCVKLQSSDGVNFSEFSEEKCFLLENYLKPPAISSVTPISSGKVQLTWKPTITPQHKFDYYEIYQFKNGGLFSISNYIQKNATSIVINNIEAGVDICFKMKIMQNDIRSEFSDSICTKTFNNLVAPKITNLRAVNSSTFKLDWENSTPNSNFEYFRLYTSTDNGITYDSGNRLYTVSTSNLINYIIADKNYCYKLKIFDGLSSSAFSNEICGKTENNLIPPELVKTELINMNYARLTWKPLLPKSEFDYYYIYGKVGKGDWRYLSYTINTDSTILVNGIIAGEENCYAIKTLNGQNFSSYSNEICIKPVNNLLPPEIIRADTINSKQIKLVWKPTMALDQFDYYELYRKIGNGAYRYENSVNKSTKEHTFYNIKANEENCFKLLCVSGFNKSDYSNEVCVQTKNNLKAPMFNSLNSKNNAFSLAWQSPQEGQKPEFYEIFRSSNGGDFTLVNSKITATSVTVGTSLLLENIDYCYKIRSSDGINVSEFSEEKCAKIIGKGTELLKLLAVERTSFYYVKLTWKKPQNIGTGTYIKIYSKYDNQEYTGWADSYSNDTINVFYLPYYNQQQVCYKICLSDNYGNLSDFSNEICIETKLDNPKPNLIEAKRLINNNIELKWEIPESNNSFGYFNVYRAVEGETNLQYFGDFNINTRNFIDKTALFNVNYCYKVVFRNYGVNKISESNTLCITNTPKSAPNNLKATNITCDRVELSWSDFESNFNETSFELMRSEDGANGNYKYLDLPAANITSFIDTKVESGKTYHYALRGKFGDSFSPFTAALQVTLSCNAPTNVKISKIGCTGLAITWDDLGSINIEESYEIFRSKNGINGNYEKIGISGQNINYFTDINLDVNSEVFYKIRGQFAKGYSTFSEPSGAFTNSLTLSKVKNGATYVKFALVNCGEGVENWSIWQSEDGKNYKEVMLVNARESSFKVKNLIENRTYYFVISPITKKGHSGFSNVVKVITPDFPKPTNITIRAIGASRLKLNWKDNSSDDDFEEAFVISQQMNDKIWKTIGKAGQNETSFIVDSLNTDSVYCFKVSAQYYQGYSQYSNMICAKPSKIILNSSLENGSVLVSWADSLNVAFVNTDSIKLWRKLENDLIWKMQSLIGGNKLSFKDSTIKTNTKYCYYLSSGKEESKPICTLSCPEIIKGFVAKSTQKGVIDIEWKQVLENNVQVYLSYSEDGIVFIPIILLDPKLYQLKFNIFKAGNTYWFKINTKNAVCETSAQIVKVTVANVRESAVYIPGMESLTFNQNTDIKVFPNPISDKVTVEINTKIKGKINMQLIDSKGSILFFDSINDVTDHKYITIDTSNLTVGTYFLITHFNNNEEVFKLLKK